MKGRKTRQTRRRGIDCASPPRSWQSFSLADEHLLQLVIIPSPGGLCPSGMKLGKLWHCWGSGGAGVCVTRPGQEGAAPSKPQGMGFSCFHVCPSADSGSGLLISSIRLERVFSTTSVQKYFHSKPSAALQRQGRGMRLDEGV